MVISQKNDVVQAIQQFIVGVLTYISIFAGSLFLSREMGPTVFGNYSIAIAVLSIFTTILLLGTDTAATRFITPLYEEHKKIKVVQYVSWNMHLIKRSFQICLSICALLFLIGCIFHVANYVDFSNYQLAFYSVFLTPVMALSTLISSYMIAFKRVLVGTIFSTMLIHVLILVNFVGAVYLFDINITINSNIFFILALSVFTLLLLETFRARRRIVSLIHALRRGVDTFSGENAQMWFSTSFHLIGAQIIYIVLRYMDLFIVKIFSSESSEAGIYSAIMVITHLIYFVPIAITFLVKPAISSFYDKPEHYSKLQEIIDATNTVIFICCPILLFIICFWSTEILAFFGPEYVAANNALIIFSLGCAFIGLTRVPQTILLFSGKETVIFYTAIVNILTLLILGIPATYFFNLDGMATVVACSFLVQGTIYVILAKHYLPGIKPVSIF
jgi:O-antigen/teichoic acid export membrane protein